MRATWSGAPMVAIPPALAGWDAPRTQPHRQRHPQHWTPPHPACPQCSPHRLQQPIFTSSHQSRLRFEQQPDDSPPTQRPNMGGFATIGPRHAGARRPKPPMVAIPPALAGWDAPRTRPHRQRHPQHWTPPHPTRPKRSPPRLKQPIFTSSHRSGRRFEHQPNGSPPTQRPNRGFCYHRPPTRRRHAVRSLLWSQFPPLARLDPPQTRPHRQKHPQH